MIYRTFSIETPIRLDAEHYQIASSSQAGIYYHLHFNHMSHRWQCDCPDATGEHLNFNCKHRRRLLDWIHEQKAQRSREQAAIWDAIHHNRVVLAGYGLLPEQEARP